jgi:sterol 3beta-glucosyltransferase
MRAGTQTLIQALQALPLVDDPEIEDELPNHDSSLADSDSDDDGKQRGSLYRHGILCQLLCSSATTLASSIHTIHRPVARSRRHESLHTLSAVDDTSGDPADLSSGQEQLQRSMMSDEETDADDFELPKSVAPKRRVSKKDRPIGLSPVLEHAFPKSDRRYHAEREGSVSTVTTVTTVKLNRRARLAEKLAEVFDTGGINEVIAGGMHLIHPFDTIILMTGFFFVRDALLVDAIGP